MFIEEPGLDPRSFSLQAPLVALNCTAHVTVTELEGSQVLRGAVHQV